MASGDFSVGFEIEVTDEGKLCKCLVSAFFNCLGERAILDGSVLRLVIHLV